jgi:hypothetical protein
MNPSLSTITNKPTLFVVSCIVGAQHLPSQRRSFGQSRGQGENGTLLSFMAAIHGKIYIYISHVLVAFLNLWSKNKQKHATRQESSQVGDGGRRRRGNSKSASRSGNSSSSAASVTSVSSTGSSSTRTAASCSHGSSGSIGRGRSLVASGAGPVRFLVLFLVLT